MLDLPHYGAFDILVCQIPTIASYKSEGGGALGATKLIQRNLIFQVKH